MATTWGYDPASKNAPLGQVWGGSGGRWRGGINKETALTSGRMVKTLVGLEALLQDKEARNDRNDTTRLHETGDGWQRRSVPA